MIFKIKAREFDGNGCNSMQVLYICMFMDMATCNYSLEDSINDTIFIYQSYVEHHSQSVIL